MGVSKRTHRECRVPSLVEEWIEGVLSYKPASESPEVLVNQDCGAPPPEALGEVHEYARQANSQLMLRLVIQDPTLRALGLERTMKKRHD